MTSEFTGIDEPIICSWDDASIHQLDNTASEWDNFHREMDFYLHFNQDTKSLKYMALYVLENEELLIGNSANLAIAFQKMMESKLEDIRFYLHSAIITKEMMTLEKYKTTINAGYIRDIFRFAPMHDIGKVGIEDYILLKKGKLTAEERTRMQDHPSIGAEVLRRSEEQMKQLGYSIFTVGIEIASGHHEKWDGSGYPSGLAGEKIPLSARIIAAADVFDALTSRRPYKEAWSVEKALIEIKNSSGKHFDPDVVTAFKNSLPRIMEVYNKYKHV